MTQIYEGMFLLDNQAVRDDWKSAKALVTSTLTKHGATVHTARRWDERRLAYPIKGRLRATYLLTFYEIPAERIPAMQRDFELNERVLRVLELSVDEIPEGEDALSRAELDEGFSVPAPPPDHAPDPEPEPEPPPAGRQGLPAKRLRRGWAGGAGAPPASVGEGPAEAAPEPAAQAAEAPAAETPASEAPASEAPAPEAPAPEAPAPATPAAESTGSDSPQAPDKQEV